MTFTLNVNIGLSPQLAGFLTTLLGSQVQPTAVELPHQEQSVIASEEPAHQVPLPEEPATAAVVTTETVIETTEATAADTAEEREYTEADVRAAIDRARQRIEGDDWNDNPDGEGYKKWHRALTSWFKVTAALFGADRPSELPDSRSRMNFIRCCDEVEIKDGALVEAVPF
jgi:hypothetical protein